MDHSSRLFCFIFNSILFAKGLADITLVGSTIELKCLYQATSANQLKWSKINPQSPVLYSSNAIILITGNTDIMSRINITGNHKIGEYHLSISDVRKSDSGTYECLVGGEKDLNQLTVVEGPSGVIIDNKSSDNKLLGIEDQDMTLSCTAKDGDPVPDMVLQIRNQNYTKNSTRTIHHTISRVDRSYDGGTVTCMTGYQSISYFPKSDTENIYLYLKPSTPLISPYQLVTEETKPLSVTCTSSGGRPKPTVKWSIDNADITSQSTNQSTHDTATDTYTVTSKLIYSVDRNNNGKTLSCGFRNTATGDSNVSQSKTLDVQFAPSVTVGNKTYNPSDKSRQITCYVNGNPADYTFSKWQHKSKHGTVIRMLDGNSTLTLPKVSEESKYQDTGEYICTVSNGIQDIDGNVDQQASGYVVSRAPPIILSGDQQTKLGQTNNDVTILVDVYSEPKYTSLTWLKENNTIFSSDKFDKYTMTAVSAVLTDTFYDTKVQVDGYRLTLAIHNLKEQDFVNYTLKLGNGVGQTMEHVVILLSASPPEVPTNFTQIGATESTITLQWLPAYNGGHEQTFIVEYQTSGSSNWIKATVPKTLHASKIDLQTYTLSGLQDGTSYNIRVYAENKYNQSNATEIVTVSTLESFGQGAMIGAVVGVLAVVIVVVILAVIIIRKRRDDNGAKKIPRSEFGSGGEDGLKDNILYKSIDTGSKTPMTSEYAEVQKPNDVYAEINKPKPQINTKVKKPKATKSPRKEKLKQKATNNNSAAEEYVNQSEYANTENPIVGYKNADGLQYADITFSNPPKTKTGKSVIHGLDERTIYCDVDHTKKAPPPPQEGAYELTEISQGKQC